MVTLSLIHIFRYVIQAADSRSMNEAAKALYISQPSLSGAIKELEKEIGIELFKRSSHGTVLTPEGEEFLGYARQVTDQYQLLENLSLIHIYLMIPDKDGVYHVALREFEIATFGVVR